MELPASLMCDRRPLHVDEAIAAKLSYVSLSDRHGDWDFRGDADDYWFHLLPQKWLLHWLQANPNEIPRGHVIDAGAGLTRTIKRIKNRAGFEEATALGCDIRDGSDYIRKSQGDLQSRKIYDGVLPADLIVSQMTILHLVDPLAAIELLANKLKPEGHMLLQFPADRGGGVLRELVFRPVLEDAGLEVIDYSDARTNREKGVMSVENEIHILRPSDQPVRFDVAYLANYPKLYDLDGLLQRNVEDGALS